MQKPSKLKFHIFSFLLLENWDFFYEYLYRKQVLILYK
jgi:hypothetical protein